MWCYTEYANGVVSFGLEFYKQRLMLTHGSFSFSDKTKKPHALARPLTLYPLNCPQFLLYVLNDYFIGEGFKKAAGYNSSV